MTEAVAVAPSRSRHGILSPLRHVVFRRIWTASVLSNLGLLIMGVGAAWSMTQLTASADMVALVQTALMLPVALVSAPAGAIADMFDRRKVGLVALSVAFSGAVCLSIIAWLGLVSPLLLLAFCFIIGSGMALFGPAWQASVGEQVPADSLPSAIALNGISYNIARSFGPAIGGVIVASLGAVSAFATNALFYLPLIVVLVLWRRTLEPSRLPPERMARAVTSGVRYILHSPAIRVVLWRTLITGIAGGSVSALMPLVARELLHRGAENYGVMLGCFGMGAVIGALNVTNLRSRVGEENAIRMCVIVMGAGVAVVALSRLPLLTGLALVVAGSGWTASVTLFNVGVQLAAPRWVAGRALAAYQAAIAGGIALGSWIWGNTANLIGVRGALLCSAAALLASSLLGIWLRMPQMSGPNVQALDPLADPEVRLSLTPRSGPVVVEIEYRIEAPRARSFYAVM
jgi:MFS family permease